MEKHERPWGFYEILYKNANTQVKRIEIRPGMRFSLQKHMKRAEKWIIVSGEGIVTLGERTVPIRRGTMIEVEVQQVHRMENTTAAPLVFIEVQFGEYLGDDDIIRLHDDFSRS